MLNYVSKLALSVITALTVPYAWAKPVPAQTATDQLVKMFQGVTTLREAMRAAQPRLTAKMTAFLNQKIAIQRNPEDISFKRAGARGLEVKAGSQTLKLEALDTTETYNFLLNGQKVSFLPTHSPQMIWDLVSEAAGHSRLHAAGGWLLPRAEAEPVTLLVIAIIAGVISIGSFAALDACNNMKPQKCEEAVVKINELLSGKYEVRESELKDARAGLKDYRDVLANPMAIGCDSDRMLLKACVDELDGKLAHFNSGPPAILPPVEGTR